MVDVLRVSSEATSDQLSHQSPFQAFEFEEMARKSNTIIVPANAGDASSMIAAATSIMKQLGDVPPGAEFPAADASQSTFNQAPLG